MALLTEAELAYLRSDRRLARLATVGADGTPHVTPVGWSFDDEHGVFEVGGHNFAATKKYRDVAKTGKAALVIDDVLPPWSPRGIEIRGDAEIVAEPEPRIRIYPRRIVSWGLDGQQGRNARSL